MKYGTEYPVRGGKKAATPNFAFGHILFNPEMNL
jgi:hypothetical protein